MELVLGEETLEMKMYSMCVYRENREKVLFFSMI